MPERVRPPLSGRWTMVHGLRVFSRVCEPEAAAGPPIVHVHGFAISGRYLEPTAVRLADRYPTYVPDLPGHGYSEKPRTPLGIRELADALAGYLDSVDVPRAVILGNSAGCLVAAEFAHRFPERTERAVLVSPAGGRYNRPLARGVLQLARDGLREPPALALVALPDYVRYGLLNSVRAFRGMIRYPLLERLARSPVPFLTVIGSRDPLVSAERMTRLLRSPAEMHLMCHFDAAHAINFSHPEALARLVDAYVQGESLREVAETHRVIAYVDAPPL